MRVLVCLLGLGFLLAAQTPEQLFQTAVAAQQSGHYRAAIREYRQILKTHPDSPNVLANLGAALVHEKQYDEAIASYRAALKHAPGNAAIERNLALAYYKKGDFRDAEQEFSKLWQVNPGGAGMAALLGECEVRLGEPAQAAALLKPVVAAHPGNLDAAYILGLALIDTGKRRDGAALVEHVAQQRNNPHAFLLAGSTWLDLDEFQKARNDLEAALRLNPNLPGLHSLVGVERDHFGEFAGAEAEFRKALTQNPNDFRANLTFGAELYKQRKLNEAQKYLLRAVALKPSSAVARYELALVKRANGDLTAAAADLQIAVKEKPGWLDPHVALATLYYQLHRPADGLKQRQIVEKITAEQQKQGPK